MSRQNSGLNGCCAPDGEKETDVRFAHDQVEETGLWQYNQSWPQATPVLGRRRSLLRSARRALSR
jgi:hypothetical protein